MERALPALTDLPDEPLWYEWCASSPYFRVVPRESNLLAFNTNMNSDWQVPIFCAASSLEAAICQSPLLHDPPPTAVPHPFTLSLRKVAQCQYAVLHPRGKLLLINLTPLGSDRLRLPQELIPACSPEHSTTSRAAVDLLHTKYPEADGIRWTSCRFPPADCVLLFGDRVLVSLFEMGVDYPELRDLDDPGAKGFLSLQTVMLKAGVVPSP